MRAHPPPGPPPLRRRRAPICLVLAYIRFHHVSSKVGCTLCLQVFKHTVLSFHSVFFCKNNNLAGRMRFTDRYIQ
jgi:hypothetical protein